jgi:hypothetical protein
MNKIRKENKDGAHPFHSDSRVYCGRCTNAQFWKIVDECGGFRKDDLNYYLFKCHGKSKEIPCEEFILNHRINGPQHKSFIVFEKE